MRQIGPSLLSVVFAIATASSAISAEIGENVGTVGAVTPSASATLASERRDLARSLPVKFGERIATTTRGNVSLAFQDDTRLFVAENSDILIDTYVYDTAGRIDMRLAQGVLRLASGKIGGQNITVRTSVAEIGLRGTVLVVGAEVTRTILYVEQGSIEVTAAQQAVTVNEGEALVVERSGPGEVSNGWPEGLSIAVASMSARLSTVADMAFALPVEITTNLERRTVEDAARTVPASDSSFGYN